MLKMKESITQFLRLPAICSLCRQAQNTAEALCSFCYDNLPAIPHPCFHCATPMPNDDHPLCGQCIQKKPDFQRAYIAFLYEAPLRGLIQQFKYQEKIYLRTLLAKLMFEALKSMDAKPQCLIPVPLHKKRLQERGYNQSLLLAKSLSQYTKIPLRPDLCQKTIATETQAGLNKTQRKQNLKNCFEVRQNPFQHILLVDDILTTGQTANTLARAFIQAGVARVDICCVARA